MSKSARPKHEMRPLRTDAGAVIANAVPSWPRPPAMRIFTVFTLLVPVYTGPGRTTVVRYPYVLPCVLRHNDHDVRHAKRLSRLA